MSSNEATNTGKTGNKVPPTYLVINPGNFSQVFMTKELSAALAEARLGFNWSFYGGVKNPTLSFFDETGDEVSQVSAMRTLNEILSRTSRAGVVYDSKDAMENAGGKKPPTKNKLGKVVEAEPSKAKPVKQRGDGKGSRFYTQISDVLAFLVKSGDLDLVQELPEFTDSTYANDWHVELKSKPEAVIRRWKEALRRFLADQASTSAAPTKETSSSESEEKMVASPCDATGEHEVLDQRAPRKHKAAGKQ